LVQKYPEHSQLMVMGVARGLLVTEEYHQLVGICRQLVWEDVLDGKLEPSEWELQSVGDYMLDAYEAIGNKRLLKQTEKDIDAVEAILESIRLREAARRKPLPSLSSYELLKEENKFPAMYKYEEFLLSLGLDFSTNTLTTDKTTPFSLQTGKKIGRNEICPCGSGQKYKKCHGSVV
jgi:preprotein translocase subunit SecA